MKPMRPSQMKAKEVYMMPQGCLPMSSSLTSNLEVALDSTLLVSLLGGRRLLKTCVHSTKFSRSLKNFFRWMQNEQAKWMASQAECSRAETCIWILKSILWTLSEVRQSKFNTKEMSSAKLARGPERNQTRKNWDAANAMDQVWLLRTMAKPWLS
jgi:hypothetical protein